MKLFDLRELLKQYAIKPNRRRGQNFLIDKNILHKIVDAAELKKTDNVLEIGPGPGILTFELAPRAAKVLAIEADKRLFALLGDRLTAGGVSTVQLVNADALRIEPAELNPEFSAGNYKIVANLPYGITGRFLKKYLDPLIAPKEMTLMVQREVAERITAKPGEMSLLAVAVQFYAEPKICFPVSRTCFSPSPNVDSAVIRLTNIGHRFSNVNQTAFWPIVKSGFAAKRKQLKNNLRTFGVEKVAKALAAFWLKENARAEELSVEDWVKLTEEIRN
ncbi:ribosomal RNA small subunit methyltransferase A [Candidatus Falkowbacteria bacterium RIFOXYC2_FULL_48_21]|uniref:Ribosomal RNA small subunit methyltransferase A n=1 Tax=Candidatus Falkowbacteria bacterium RIFOXYC2_FULL_48_21 TaxID=1798005 RepID=A0A1F5TFG2_9BACT|nr:MAG: ribosomal RNA small subunit methyltransferase A [Candidatus Falkowbacteria bacterium RIFOXYC2_FULL_48_21]